MDLESTAIEQPAEEPISLTDQLSAAFDEYDAEADDLPEAASVEEPAEEQPEAPTEEPETPPKPETLSAPEHWSAEHRELFEKMGQMEGGKAYQEFLLNRHKEMEGDYTRKSQDLADVRKNWESVQEVLKPFEHQLQQSGMTEAQMVRNWAQAEQYLAQSPTEAIKWLADQYGADLGKITGNSQAQDDDEFTDPEVKALKDELNSLRSQMTRREQSEAQARLTTYQQQIQDFGEARTEAGEPAHPYFDDVLEDMVSLAAAERQAGRQPDLEQLYDKAVWANPGVREKLIAAQQEAAAKKADEEARAHAAKARKASKQVSGAPGGQAPSPSSLSLREQLESQFNG